MRLARWMTSGLAWAGAIAVVGIARADWTQWRGPNRDGVAVGVKLPNPLPASLGAPLWRTAIGEGHSSPVVSGGRVYIMGRTGDTEYALGLDQKSGKEIWRVSYACDYKSPDPRGGNGPNSTPTIAGDQVFFHGVAGAMHCVDGKSGKIVWKHDFMKEFWGQEKDADGVDKAFPPCGASASPLVVGDKVYIPIGGKKVGALAVLDRKTGKLLKHALPERSSYSSPILVNLAGVPQLVTFTGLRMVGVSVDDLKLLWDAPVAAFMEQTIMTPVIWKDRVIMGIDAKPIQAMVITKEGAGFKANRAWQNATLGAYTVTSVVMGDLLVGFDQKSKRLVGVDLQSGETRWSGERLGSDYVSLTIADGKLLVLSKDGSLTVGEVTDKGFTQLVKWTLSEQGGSWANLAISDGMIYVKLKNELVAYRLPA